MGDSRAILLRPDDTFLALTRDNHPDIPDEKQRIEAEESLTERQAEFLQMLSNRHEIDMDGQDIYGLTKMQAKSIIGRYKQSLPRVHSWN